MDELKKMLSLIEHLLSMKDFLNRIYLFLLFGLLFSFSKSEAHNYIPIPEDSTVRWIMYYQYYDQGWCEENYLFNYRLVGDTLINGENYKKVFVENIMLTQNTAGLIGCGQPIGGYLFAFRQDTLLKKCYVIPRDSINEQIIYDFSLQVNDTFRNFYFEFLFNNGCPDSIPTLHSLDSVSINNQNRLRQNFNCINYVIEGIGWLTDPFMFDKGIDIHLVCMKEDTSLLYLDPNFGFYCNWFPINIKMPDDKSHLSVRTSIDGSEINIVCDQTISKIEIYDLIGRKIYSDDYENNSIELETFSFPDFIIMRIFLNDNSIITKKIILK